VRERERERERGRGSRERERGSREREMSVDVHELRNGTLLACGGGAVKLNADQQNVFAHVVSTVYTRWQALILAVEHQWGGVDSRQKANDARDELVTRFVNARGSVHADEVEDYLDDMMIEQFNTEVEDGSTRQVAEDLVRMFQLIAKNEMEQVNAWLMKVSNIRLPNAVREPGQDDDDDDDNDDNGEDDNDDDDEMDDDDDDNGMHEDEEARAEDARRKAQEDEERRMKQEVMEEDGFTVIQNRRGRKKK